MATKALTDTMIRTAKVGMTLTDAGHPGLRLLVQKTVKRWTYRFRDKGKLRVITLGYYIGEGADEHMGLAEARQAHQNYVVAKKGNKDIVEKRKTDKAGAYTVKKLCGDYIRQYAQVKKRSWKEDDRMLTKDIIPLWGDREASSITPVEVVDLMDAVRLRGERAAQLLLATLRKAYSVAIQRHRVKINPCSGVEIFTSEKPDPRFLDFPELKTFLEKLPTAPMFDATKDVLHLQLLTAARKGEVCEMEWSEVNFDEKVWTLPKAKAKNKQAHRVMLSKQAMEIIERQPKKDDNNYVFASRRKGGHVRGDSVNESLNKSMKHFGLSHFTPHALRHSALTGLSCLGATGEIQDRVSNHKDKSSVRKHYDHYRHDKEAREWLQTFADHLDSLMEDNNVVSISRDAKTSGQ